MDDVFIVHACRDYDVDGVYIPMCDTLYVFGAFEPAKEFIQRVIKKDHNYKNYNNIWIDHPYIYLTSDIDPVMDEVYIQDYYDGYGYEFDEESCVWIPWDNDTMKKETGANIENKEDK